MKGQSFAIWLIVLLLLVTVIGGGAYLFTRPTTESTISTTGQLQQITTEGDVASVKVYVRDLSNNNINTKLATATYCQDDDKNFIIDGTTSSTTTEITGQTTRGKTITCWAFDSTHQTLAPATVTVDEEVEHVVINAFTIPTNGKIQIYNDVLSTGTGGVVNVTSVGASSTGTMTKVRYTNNNTDRVYPLGGLYFDTVTSTNISSIQIQGNAILSLKGSSFLPAVSSASVSPSDLATDVSTRKELWNYVFEISPGGEIDGVKKALLLEENDFVETPTVRVTGDGDGCSSTGELVSMYSFSKGYFRGTLSDDVAYGHETDAAASAVITADNTGETFYCKA